MSFSIKLGNFLFKNAYGLYKPMYVAFKNRQDKFEIEILKKYLKPNDIVLDIGANIGFYTRILSEIVGPKGKIHCFEPDKINFEKLKDFCADLNNVILNHKAVGPKTETLKIYTSKTLNVDHRTYKPDDYDQEIEIEAVSVDEYLNAENKIDFIKMDIQGFEMSAIKGLEKTLDANPGVKLISELWPYGLKKAGASAIEYFNFLSAKDFKCYLIENNSLEALSLDKIKQMMDLSEEHYFNIFASRSQI